ncbi:MAG: hypothetical protein ACNA78_09495 [Balneolaceae bacterium]
MKRLLLFIGVFLGTALLVFLLVFGLNWNSFTLFFENRASMAEGSEWVEKTYSLRGLGEYVAEHPDQISIASVVTTAPDSALYFQPDTPRTLGAAGHLFHLIAVADLIERGELDADQPLEWSAISRHQLPDVDASSHRISRRAAENRGWLNNEQISLQHAAQLLAEHKDLALADALWWTVGTAYWHELPQRLGIEQTEMPLPWSGLYLAIAPSIQQAGQQAILDEWLREEGPAAFRRHATLLSEQFLTDPEFRTLAEATLSEQRLGNTFMEERDALALFPQGTARELAGILARITSGELISSDVSRRVMEWMQWPMEQMRGIDLHFETYGAIYDHRMGLLSGVDAGTSAYTGHTTVQAVLFDRLPIAFWLHMSSNHMHQDFQQRLIYDPAMIEWIHQQTERASRLNEPAGEAINP